VCTQLLYIAPEKLLNPSVLGALRKLDNIPLVRAPALPPHTAFV